MTSSPESTAETRDFELPGYADVEAAAARLAGFATVTPLLEWAALNEKLGARVLLKPESLQRTGSFKFRGAYNRISQLTEAERRRGVLAYSSGNHAQGVAAAAALVGTLATIIMPGDAPAIKIDNTRGYGAEVVFYDRFNESRDAAAAPILARSGATLVRPYDDPDIIAGQGTCGREIAQQADALGARLDAVLICCGGGGLTAGCALALNRLSPGTEIYTVEPAAFDDTARSLASGKRQGNDPQARSFCDALLAKAPGEITFAINRRLVESGLTVTDEEVAAAMLYAFRTLKLVLEPGGAAALAAVLAGRLDLRGKTVAVVLSGGNVDPALFAEVIRGEAIQGARR